MQVVADSATGAGTESETAATAPAAAAPPAGTALLEAIDREGLVRQAWRIERWPLTIGRALDNDVVMTDPHVAAHHARVSRVRAGAPLSYRPRARAVSP
jgi:pSer/pThr/pTyr-binding forkhead associated (FHA) protein